MSTMRIGLAIGLSALLVGSAPASFGQQQSASPLQDVGELLVGRWTGEGVYAADYPGVGRKGEEFTTTHTCGWVAGGAAIRCEGSHNETTWTGLYWWDAAAMEIKTVGVNSGGNWAEGTISKQGTSLVWASSGSFSDGRKVEYKGETTFQDNGNTYVETGATILDGVSNEFSDTYKRVAR
jgi:hypothetical protein